jgi:hypothetical protein
MQLGKFSSDRDSALHFLCSSEWSNESFGDVNTFGKYVWRISNTWEDVKPTNIAFNSVIEEWLINDPDIEAIGEEFRKALEGHFIVTELDSGQVLVFECETELQLISIFNVLQEQWEEFNKEDGE